MFLFTPFINYKFNYLGKNIDSTYKVLQSIKNLNISSIIYIIIFILISYIMGHLIKIFSKKLYQLSEKIFDEYFYILFKNTFDKNLLNFIKYESNEKYNINIFIIFSKLLYFIITLLKDIFLFCAKNYDDKFNHMHTECIQILQKKYHISKKHNIDDWYVFYKLAQYIENENNIKTKAREFLAKYNFYRSCSCIFLVHLIFLLLHYKIGFSTNPKYNDTYLIIILDILFWFTFHTKYKRYWTMCSNETISSLYYILKFKNTINQKNNIRLTIYIDTILNQIKFLVYKF